MVRRQGEVGNGLSRRAVGDSLLPVPLYVSYGSTMDPSRLAARTGADPARLAEGLKPPRWYLDHFLAARDRPSRHWVAWLEQVETTD